MADRELQEIRAQRLAQLQASTEGSGVSVGPLNSTSNPSDQAKAQRMEELRDQLLLQILDNEARQRLQRISLVKPDKARAVEDQLISLAQTGRLRGIVSEQALIQFLNQLNQPPFTSNPSLVSETNTSGPKIVYSRKRFEDSDDDEDYGL